MAIYKQGILGPFSGKVGTVVGSSWRGITYIRSLATKVRNPKTAAQTAARTRMAATAARLKLFSKAIGYGFTNAGRAGGWSEAVKLHRLKTIEQTAGSNDWLLRPQDINLTTGDMAFSLPINYNDGLLGAEWTAGENDVFADGVLVVVFFNETAEKAATFITNYMAGEFTGDVGNLVANATDKLHLYAFFANSEMSTITYYRDLSA